MKCINGFMKGMIDKCILILVNKKICIDEWIEEKVGWWS